MWDRLKKVFAGGRASVAPKADQRLVRDEKAAISAIVVCDRCGEEISVRMRKSSDIPRDYQAKEYTFFVQKTVVGTECFNRIDMRLEFDARYRLVNHDVTGGSLKPNR